MSFDWMALLYLLLAFFPAVLLHESGHYLAARALGATAGRIRIGAPGERALTLPLGRLRLEIHPGWRLWFTVPVCYTEGRRYGRLPNLLCSLAGPLACAVASGLLWPATPWLRTWASGLLAGRLFLIPATLLDALAYWLFVLFLIPLIPVHYRATGIDSDGLQIWNALQRKSPPLRQ